jgi:hypothetical protein
MATRKAICEQVRSGNLKGQWRFKLQGNNNRIVGSSYPETYINVGDMMKTLLTYFPDFEITGITIPFRQKK